MNNVEDGKIEAESQYSRPEDNYQGVHNGWMGVKPYNHSGTLEHQSWYCQNKSRKRCHVEDGIYAG